MDGTQAIVKKIIDDANFKAQSIINNAENLVNAKINEAKEFSSNYLDAQLSLAKKEAKEIVERKLIVADLDVRKNLLKEKQDLITKTFDSALEKLCKIEKKKYLSLVEKLIVDNAEEGDRVILSADNVLCESDLTSLAVFNEKKLKIDKNKGAFIGGVMLIGNNCDKDLTFKSIIAFNKELLSSKVSQLLFEVER
jgi:V/A-type H+-transporting ATPase subunit E